MDAYYVPPEFIRLLGNGSNRIALYNTTPPNQAYVDIQKFGEDLELVFGVNGQRVWGVRFSSRVDA